MKVNFLYIINHGMLGLVHDDESMAVCKGLYLKYKGKCGAVGAFKATSGNDLQVIPGHLSGPLPLAKGAPGEDKVDAAAAKELLEKAPATAQGQNRSVGIYIVSHGPAAIAPEPELVAKSIDALLPEAAKPKLHYVAVVACMLADAEKDTEGNFDLNREDATYMTKLMKELNARKMRPVAAGWDVFISVAPHQPMTQATASKQAKPRKVFHDGKATNMETIPGKKFVQKNSNTYQTVSSPGVANEYRKLHKHLYQVTDDNQLRVARGTWSTFTQ